MKKFPLVSVFLPTYNQQDFIGESIDSVLGQDYDSIEIVIGDDCSSDNTWEIVQHYQHKFPEKIKAFRNPKNLGITGNCNELLKHCSGTYIAFTAGDDLFLPGKIRKQVELMGSDQNTVLSYHDIQEFNSKTNTPIRYWNHGALSTKPMSGAADKVARGLVEKGTSFMAALSVMVRRDAVPAAGFDKRIPVASDWFMWIEVLANARKSAKVVFINEVLARYRRHDSNITNNGYKYFSDVLTTLALVESNYPWLIDEVTYYHAGQRYSRGIRLIREGHYLSGRRHLIQSARVRMFSWKWVAWLAVSYFPALLKIGK